MQAAAQDEVRAAHRFGGLLRQRNFRLLWIGESVSGIGNAMAVVGIPLLAVTVLRASTFAVAALTAAAYLPWLVIGLPAGAWVDRLPARPLMIGCDVISALLYASLPAAAWIGVLTTAQVTVVALLAGAANVFFATAYQVYLPALVTAAELVEGNAKLQGSASVATIGGRGAAGLAAQAVGDATALLFNGVSFLVSAACLLCIRTAAPPREPIARMTTARTTTARTTTARTTTARTTTARTTTVRAEVTQGIRFVAGDPYLRPLTAYGAVANLAYTGNLALVVVFLIRVVGLGPAAVGLLMATGGVGGLLGALAAGRLARWLGTARALLLTSALGTGLFGLLIPLTGTGPKVAYYVIGAAVVAAGIVVGNIIVGSFRQAYCPPEMLGRVAASMRFLAFGAIPLGALLAGGLAVALGVRYALWVVLALYALSGVLLLTRGIRTRRDLPGAPAGQA
jgi:MFS family permease